MIFRRQFISILLALSLVVLTWLTSITTVFALGGTQPALNQSAPEFILPTNIGDGSISLSDYRGKWVVLYFYPKDFTSGCTLEAKRFQQDLPQYIAKNVQILGISADDVDSHAQFCDSEGLKFPLLADSKGEVSKKYGSWMGFISLRHTYLIDPDGILREIFLGVQPAIHSQEVLARIDELQSANS